MSSHVPFRVGEWLESDAVKVNNWIGNLMSEIRPEDKTIHPTVENLKNYIEGNEEVLKLFQEMFDEVPFDPPYDKDPDGNPQIRSYLLFLEVMDRIISTPPRYESGEFVGAAIYEILNWCIGTPAACTLFLNEELNEYLRLVLNEWTVFLLSPESTKYLTEDPVEGSFGSAATSMVRNAEGNKAPFHEVFVCDPTQPHYGFSCWNDYFTRQFRPGQRPVHDADDDSKICNGCESAPYKIAYNVQKIDQFWIKGQPYSLHHMLRGEDDTVVDYFTGGTVYQAYLSAMNYHRWHSPVNGRVLRVRHIAGSYFAGCPEEGFDASGSDSQRYMTEVATRALMFLQCDNPTLGMVCFMAVGMGEVSTCEITCQEGDVVRKGDELGMFHFGGSTYCLIFGPQVKVLFELGAGNEPGLSSSVIELNRTIATVERVEK